jgi:pimeloyl-ACP methyl ester carboxylesterase
MTKIAVALLHGIGSQCPDFADGIIQKLRKSLSARLPEDRGSDASIVFKPICWGHVLQDREDLLCQQLSRLPELNWQWLRRLIVEWLGDVIAYEPIANNRIGYDAVHRCVAEQLTEFAAQVGQDTPLCVIAHSYGSVIACNYFRDFQECCARTGAPSSAVSEPVHRLTQDSAFARGETLATMITLGSPMGLYSVRLGLTKPLALPARQLSERMPDVEGVWLNFIAQNDVMAFPLSSINAEYGRAVIDIPVWLQAGISRWHPLSHFLYWSDDVVIQSIAVALADVWESISLSKKHSRRSILDPTGSPRQR